MGSDGREGFKTVGNRQKSTTRMAREAKLADFARRRRHLLHRRDLNAHHFDDKAIQRRVEAGRLYRVHPAVYCTHAPPLGWLQRIHAAVLACGLGAAAGHLFAANLLTVVDNRPAGPIDIVGAGQRGRKLDGIRTHRAPLDPRDRTRVDGIPCTAAARTLVDIASLLDDEALEDALIAADSLRILNRPRLEELIEERAGRPGMSRLAAFVSDDPVETQHKNERRMFSLCREFGIPRPLTQYRIDVEGRTYFADFCWPELRLIVEFDSWRWHGGRTKFEYDADRDQLLRIAGWQVVHFTRDQVVLQREQTGNRLVALTRSQVPLG
jgi:very-short-patch-repair endonuclease